MRLPRSFFARDTRAVARELLGMRLVRQLPGGARLAGIIVETEAYRPGDAASHGYRRQTTRNAAMFMRPGTAYVYFTYGMHFCFNVVTEDKGVPAAVLIRALEPLDGVERMRENRSAGATKSRVMPLRDLCRGPARLCQALQIDLTCNREDVCRRESRLFFERGTPLPEERVRASPRIGVSGDDIAVSAEWRWFDAASAFVSRARAMPPAAI